MSAEQAFNENCGDENIILISAISFLLFIPLALLYALSLLAFFNRNKMFHPNFATVLLSLLLVYTFGSTTQVIRNISFFALPSKFSIETRSSSVRNIEKMFVILDFMVQPFVLIGLIERLCATIFVSKYENWRPWVVLACAYTAACYVVSVEFEHRKDLENSNITKKIQAIFALVTSLGLIVLLTANRIMIKASAGKSKLSRRYQLVENVKALRLYVPIIVIDSTVQWILLATDTFFHVSYVLDLNLCYDVHQYLKKFLLLRVVRNVLGQTVSGQDTGLDGQAAHFRQLEIHWK
ncbi:unnamed protein product [Caenorhabditis bovis]|uniref:Uncharacterized protein n=1 Tax=Caenorhabditis bovis TaxID=2654633 RepID=A0A8S1EFT8_9PELO|nr:unnamed protein product [Caenorhabditis bovis]